MKLLKIDRALKMTILTTLIWTLQERGSCASAPPYILNRLSTWLISTPKKFKLIVAFTYAAAHAHSQNMQNIVKIPLNNLFQRLLCLV